MFYVPRPAEYYMNVAKNKIMYFNTLVSREYRS